MFDYPLPKPTRTLYAQLGCDTFATQGEVLDAWGEVGRRLQQEQSDLQRRLKDVYEQVPQLPATRQLVEKLLAAQDDHADSQLSKTRGELAALEKQALTIEPEYRRLLAALQEVEARIIEHNSLPIINPEGRQAYDLATPPCALLKLDQMDSTLFTDRRLAYFLLRKELAALFERDQGAGFYHPSDLTRSRFESDFIACPLLDGDHEN